MVKKISTTIPDELYERAKKKGIGWADLIRIGLDIVEGKPTNEFTKRIFDRFEERIRGVELKVSEIESDINIIKEYIKQIRGVIVKIYRNEVDEETERILNIWSKFNNESKT